MHPNSTTEPLAPNDSGQLSAAQDTAPATLPPGVSSDAPGGGVGTPNGADESGVCPETVPAQNPAPSFENALPEWSPPVPAEFPPTPWEEACREPTPDELWANVDVPARQPADYTLPPGMLGAEPDADALAWGRGLQALLWNAGMPKLEGEGLLFELAQAEKRLPADMTDVQFELHAKRTEGLLRERLGDAEYNRKRDALTEMLGDMDGKTGGKLADLIGDRAHLLLDPQVMMRLLGHSGQATARKRK